MGVLVVAFLFCVWMLFQSLEQHYKTKKLQKTADFNFKTKNGNYSFIYTIKGFLIENGKKVKILIQPVLGFSDLFKTNHCESINFELTDNFSAEKINAEVKLAGKGVSVNSFVVIPNKMLDKNNIANVHIKVSSMWILGNKQIDEELEFDYTK